MPSFLSSLRRKSRTNVQTDEPRQSALSNGHTNEHKKGLAGRKSSSTLSSSAVASASTSTTPATSTSGDVSVHPNGALKNGIPCLPIARQPRPGPNPTKRYSMNVSLHSPQLTPRAIVDPFVGPIFVERPTFRPSRFSACPAHTLHIR